MNAVPTVDRNALAAHVLRHVARAQSLGRLVHLDGLASDIGVRREDVRETVSSLHREGHLDAKRMRLTMTGLVLAAAMRDCKLRAVRRAEPAAAHARVA